MYADDTTLIGSVEDFLSSESNESTEIAPGSIICSILCLHISCHNVSTYFVPYFVNGSFLTCYYSIYRINSILLAIMSLSIIYLEPILYMYIKINFTVS